MKKNVGYLCLLIFLHQQVFCQPTYFNNRYDFLDSWEEGINVMETYSGYITVGTKGDSTGLSRLSLMFLNKQGSVLIQKCWGAPYTAYYAGFPGSLIAVSNAGYAAFGAVVDSLGGADALLYRFDHQGDTLWTHRYGDTLWQAGAQCKQTPDGGFILIGRTTTYDADGDFWLIKTDSLGNVEWEKTYGGAAYEYGLSVDVTADLGYILAGTTRSYGPGNTGSGSNILVLKVDAQGFEQWRQVFGGFYGDAVWNVAQTADYGYIVAGGLADTLVRWPDEDLVQPYLIKLDFYGNIEWERTYGPPLYESGLMMVRELANGDFIACGQTMAPNGRQAGLVLRVDAQGDSLWMRTHKQATGPDSWQYLRDIYPTSDGGFIATGRLNPKPPDPPSSPTALWKQDLWVLKLDSLGCATPGCDQVTSSGPELAASSLRVWPNPAQGLLHIEVETAAAHRPDRVRLLDLSGRVALERAVDAPVLDLAVDQLPGGIYLLEVWAGNQRMGGVKVVLR